MSKDPTNQHLEHGNVEFLCGTHAPKPDPELVDKPREFFLGKIVKIDFITHRHHEHMWLKDIRLAPKSKIKLTGVLNNYPIDPDVASRWRFGDVVVFTAKQVEEVMERNTDDQKKS